MGTEDDKDSNSTLGNDISHPQPISQVPFFFGLVVKECLKERNYEDFLVFVGNTFQMSQKEEREKAGKPLKNLVIW